jgi:hypothetical protein
MDRLPALVGGFWYDFGGTWNCETKRWDLFGDSISDLRWSCDPVLRVGGAYYTSWQDRRSIYSNAELNRIRVLPGGTNIVTLLNGGNQTNAAGAFTGANSIDACDDYRVEAFAALHYRGFSLYNDWWAQQLDNFRGQHVSATNDLNQPILYTNGAGQLSLFPAKHGLANYGQQLQAGYFVVPHKLGVCARWSWLTGNSGNINGNGTETTKAAGTIPGVPAGLGAIRVVNGAFDHFQNVNELAVGVNYFFYGQRLKWQNDVSWYNGGNPAAGGSSAAGFETGNDGWMFRSQVQLWF